MISSYTLPEERVRSSSKPILTRVLVVLCLVIVCLLIVVLVIVSIVFSRLSEEKPADVRPPLADYVLNNLDETANPCENFYQYACGGYLKKQKELEHTDVSSFGALVDEAQKQLIANLKELETRKEGVPAAVRTAVHIYNSCRSGGYDTDFTVHEALNQLKELGGWSLLDPDWQHLPPGQTIFTLMAKITRLSAIPTLLHPYVEIDYMHIERNALFFLSPVLQYTRNDNWTRQSILHTAKLLKTNITDEARLDKEIDDILRLASNLSQQIEAVDDPNAGYAEMYHPYNMADLQANWPNISWTEYMETLIDRKSNNSVNDVHYVVMTPKTMDVINEFLATCSETCQRTLISYLMLCSLRHWLATVAFPQKGFSETQCADFLIGMLPAVTGRIYVGDHYSLRKRVHMRYLISAIFASFSQRLKLLTWLDEESLENALLKVERAVTNVAYSDWTMEDEKLDEAYRHLTAQVEPLGNFIHNYLTLVRFQEQESISNLFRRPDRHDFLMSPALVNAWYIPEFNSITIPAAIMNPHFFDVSYPAAMNFGAIGSVIGHELTHGFDNMGVQFFWNGTFETWMTNQSRDGFAKMAKCVIDQYGKVCYNFWNKSLCINGSFTQGENIADNGGIKAAFNAYQMYLAIHGEETPISGLERYSMNQLFFLAFAQVWCNVYSDKRLMRQLLFNVHSPADARVTETLKNFPEFGYAFKCKRGDPMMPVQHCKVW